MDERDPILGFFVSWVKSFAERFDYIDVICLKSGTYNLPAHVSVYSLGKELGEGRVSYLVRFYRLFWRCFMRQRVDYVFFHMGAIANVLAAPFFLLRKVRHTQFYWWKTYGHLNLLERCALFFSDRVYTAVSESFPINTHKRHVVGHAIDTDLFIPNPEIRQRDTMLFVGRISRVKRIEEVIRVTRMLIDGGYQVKTRIVGAIADPQYYDELQQLVRELDLGDRVQFVGGMVHTAVVREYQQARILLNPSDTDGLDKVVLEAMSCGVVPITANQSFQTMLSPFDLFVGKHDLEAYVAQGKRALEMDDEAQEELTQALRSIVTSRHALSTLVHRLFPLS